MPVRIQLCRVCQAASHDVEAVPHARLAESQALAERTVLHPQQGPAALFGDVQMVCGIDDFNAQIQRLQKRAARQQRSPHLPHYSLGNITKGTNIPAGHPEAFRIFQGTVRHARVNEVIVDEREKTVKESVYELFGINIRTK